MEEIISAKIDKPQTIVSKPRIKPMEKYQSFFEALKQQIKLEE